MQAQQNIVFIPMNNVLTYVPAAPIILPAIDFTFKNQALPLRLEEKTGEFVEAEYERDQETNMIVPWRGYSFVDLRTGMVISPTYVSRSLSPETSSYLPSTSISQRSRSASPMNFSRESTPELEQKPLKQKKFGYLSKQNKIKKVHARVEAHFESKGLLVPDNEPLRGEDVIRVHVKNFQGLSTIEETLRRVTEQVSLLKVHTPISMKNERQMKGFIVYLKLADKRDVKLVQSIFAEDLFKKCDVALPRVEPKLEEADIIIKPIKMLRQRSAGAA